MSTETTKKKIKIDNGTEFAKVYTDKQTDSKLTAKQDVLTAGTNITIKDNVISASGGSIAATALTNEDLDTLKTEGSYYAGGNNTCTNKPTGIDAFGLTIKRVASGYYTQYLTGGNTNTGQVYTRTFTSGAWTNWIKFTQDTQLATKQDKLVSGTNIKTINGNSLLGSGDLTIEGGGSKSYIIELASLEFDKKFTLTDEQITMIKTRLNNNEEQLVIFLIKANDIQVNFNIENIFYYKANELSIDVINSTFSFGILGNTIINCEIGLREKYVIFKLIDIPSISNLSLDFNGTAPQALQLNKSFGDTPSFIGQGIYFDTINGKSILHTDSTINEYTIPDTKTISLFGNHSILVPKDSTDTNIDLYNHAIEISGTTSGNYDYSIWFNVVSSKNLVVDSLTDLKTLLGNTFKREVFGFSNTSTTPTAIIGIDETQMYNTNGETTSFANLSSITFTDTVTTI